MYTNEYGERIRKVRKELGLSQTAFGVKISCSKSTIINYESGETKPDIEVAKKIINVFGLNANWLINGEGEIFKGSADEDDSLKHLITAIKKVFPELEIDKNVKTIINALPDDILRNLMANEVIKAIKKDPELFQNIQDTVMVGGARQ